ncbi:MAG: major intrinsic protein [Candidatus Peregrinibacteria bacterium Gr01-1014_25]|nr:MAG: major intrinsic protein [Candidatus Peregrinibacteria bacterium Gr01-1014_25]
MSALLTWSRKDAAEALGTFVLALAVALSIAAESSITPLIAAITVGLFVYTIGPISGCHLNPAVTVGLLSVRKIDPQSALRYIIAQCAGALVALLLVWAATGMRLVTPADSVPMVGLAEMLGAFILVFGITAVVLGGIHAAASGLVIGGSLLLGILLAGHWSNGLLNPSVALAVGSLNVFYVLGPLIGGILGAQCAVWLLKK